MMAPVPPVTRKAFNSVHVNVTKKCAIVLNLNGNARINVGKNWAVDFTCAK